MGKTDGPLPGPELNTDEVKHLVLDEVKKYSSKTAVAFSGGEFMLRDDYRELLKYNASLGQWSFINTNGTLLNKENLLEIKELTSGKIIFVFSLNSLNQEIHGKVRDDRADITLKKAELCEEYDIPYFFVTTISKNNLDGLKELGDYAKERGTPILRSPFVPRGAGTNLRELMFDREDMENIIHPFLRENHLTYISFTPFFASSRFLEKGWLSLNIAIKQLGCQAGKGYAGITPEGEVAPCVHLLDSEVKCGNIRETPLSEILENNQIFKELRSRDKLKGKCGKCYYKNTCGGCRALAYHHTGDYLAEDPTCFFQPEDEKTRSELEEMQNENVKKFANYLRKTHPWKKLF
jgi:radical SAM protein with 4Fe4S-binding SPASM domain